MSCESVESVDLTAGVDTNVGPMEGRRRVTPAPASWRFDDQDAGRRFKTANTISEGA
jgi:hypothetical protein